MKIDEAVKKIIDETNRVRAKVDDNNNLIIASSNRPYQDWFLLFPANATSLNRILEVWNSLDHVTAQDLARVMDVIQRLLDTPVEERFPEKKYVLSAMRCVEGPVPVKQYVDAMNISTNNVEFHFGFANEKANAMEFTQEDLDSLSGFFPKDAIDAMKEEVKEYDRS